ncbi:MAG: DHA2 family efflux MFS transporter permease subunit [Alphaproteobacteria bacterium]|nr:DHA2 family efflux MFS transporter permease subunit [Alphaproteobacteria bacterium]
MTHAVAAPVPVSAAVRWLAFIAACLGSAAYVVALTTSGTALPYMQGAFSAAPDQMSWMLTSFIIGTTIVTACTGWISTRFGRKRIHLISLAGFTIASLLCGLSSSLYEAVVYRVLQGMFGAPLLPMGQAIGTDLFPPEKQGFVIGALAVGAASGAVFGPYVGGVLVELYGWPWVFFIIVPLGAIAFLSSWLFTRATPRDTRQTMSWTGFILLSIAICAFQLALNRGERLEWFESPEIIAEVAVAGLAFYAFIAHTMLGRKPFFDRALFLDRNYAVGNFLVFIYGALNFLQLFLVPVLLQSLAGYTIAEAGYLIGWRAAGLLLTSLAFSFVADRVGPRTAFVVGFLCMFVSAWSMSRWTTDVRGFDVAWTLFLQGACSAIAYIPIAVMAFATLPQRLKDEGTAVFYLMSTLGTATGTALIYNVLSRSSKVNQDALGAEFSAYGAAFRQGIVPSFLDPGIPGGLATVSAEIAKQSAMIAYNNCFLLIALVTLATIPFALIVKLPKTGETPRQNETLR